MKVDSKNFKLGVKMHVKALMCHWKTAVSALLRQRKYTHLSVPSSLHSAGRGVPESPSRSQPEMIQLFQTMEQYEFINMRTVSLREEKKCVKKKSTSR